MHYADRFMNVPDFLSSYGEYSDEQQAVSHTGTALSRNGVYVAANKLKGEPSPYLKQHALDPVGWFPWGDEAFSFARCYDRPVFLSIGYSSSHWCNVMGRNCWSDAEVAGMLNDVCVPVLVDREERPDVDYVMTEICRVQNGSAGYPVNVFMTSDGRPFMCVTWLPKRTMGRMVGMTEILPRVRWLWVVQRSDVEGSAEKLAVMSAGRFGSLSGNGKRGGRIGKFTAYQALDDMRAVFDLRFGGFGTGAKKVENDKLIFLACQSSPQGGVSQRDKSDASTMADVTMRRMWKGGIHDQLGGGFSLCSSDERWLVPHFEKLLCTNAMLLMAASMHQRNNPGHFSRLLAEDIIFSLTKDFSDGSSYSQGFVSAVDGDTEDGEGRYYLWNENEIKAVLGGDAGLFCSAYAVLPSGNFGSELAGSQMSWNILYEASTVTELARRYGIKGSEVATRLCEARKLLLDYRDRRYPIRRDTKVLMGWNGLAVAALSHASVSFNVPEWREIAERTALFITKNFSDKSGKWSHVWIDGKSYIPATSEDIAYMLWGVVELYKAAKHFNAGEKLLTDWLSSAKTLADTLIRDFWDTKDGGLFLTEGQIAGVRLKSAEDMNSLPSANSVAAIVLDELAFILEDKAYSDFARKIIGCFAPYVRENPLRCLTMITADLEWKAFKPNKKPEPAPAPVPTDEELNREDVSPPQEEQPSARQSRPSRASRRASAQETQRPPRRNRPHRTHGK